MEKKTWRKKIRAAAQAAGTYKPAFDAVIDALASILEARDAAYKDFIEDGARTTILKTSDRGAVNTAKNPKLQAWQELNTQALAYWRDLGLTPAGLKRITDAAVKPVKKSILESALEQLAGSGPD